MFNLLYFLKNVIKSKLGIAAIGFLSICWLVWLIANMLGASLIIKLILLGLIVVGFIFYLLIMWLRTVLRGKKLNAQMQNQEITGAGNLFTAASVKEKLDAAIKKLKTSELGIKYRGSAALYVLPWFIIIGPSAAGKTTLLRNSGLSYNYNEDQLPGFGGTRDCDWWFANEAIFLDTAGRYVTKDNNAEWLEFLGLLKKHRPRLPINGIIVALSLDALLKFSEEELKQNIQNIRLKIAELYFRLGYVFPVTLLFTKCDLLSGFEEFFSDLDSAEQKQIWGIDCSKNHTEQFDQLYSRLSVLRLDKLAKEPDIEKRFLIYSFPEQFKTALTKVNNFVSALVTPNPYQDTPLFCGVYFTSGTQENVNAKSYFIYDIFRDVILPNKNAAAKTKQRVKLQVLTKSIWVMICGLILIGAVMLYSTSLTSNILLLNRGENVVEQLAQNDSPTTLQSAFNYYQMLVNYKHGIPWYLRLGLYRGNVLITPLQNLLADTLQEKFAQTMSNFLITQLQHDQNEWQKNNESQREEMRGRYYSALKAYTSLCYPKHANLSEAAAVLSPYWNMALYGQTKAPNNSAANNTDGMIKFYLQYALPANPNEAALLQAKKQLAVNNPAINLSAELVFIFHDRLPSLGITDLTNDHNIELVTSENKIAGMYTLNGWRNDVKPMIAAITNKDKQLVQNLTNLYFMEYKQAWLNFLIGIRVKPFASLTEANNAIKVLTSSKSPLISVLKITAQNTSIPELKRNFDGINSFTNNQSQAYFSQVIKIQNDLQRLAMSPNLSHEAEQYAANLLLGAGGETELYQSMIATNLVTNNIADLGVRNAVKELLLQPLREAWRVVLQAARNDIEQNWQGQVVTVYQQTIANKFPFNRYSQEEIPPSELNSFLQPNSGILWSYINLNLKPFITLTGSGWQEQQWLNVGIGFSSQALQQLNQIHAASVGLFASGELNMYYQIYPIPTRDVSQIVFILNGKKYIYSNGPQVWQSFHWASGSGDQINSVTAISAAGNNLSEITANGIWGLLRLISNGRIAPDHNGSYRVTWRLTGRGHAYPIAILLRTGGYNSALDALLVGRLAIPTKLF